jgi:1,4-dihydroxy-2-naphthoate octaprenyltransferase
MDESHVKTNSLKAWVLAARPKTLMGAAVPVMIGAALAWSYSDGQMMWVPCVLCLLFAFIMQIDANFVNDYFDYKKGNDDLETRLGPLRACTMGWITPKAMRRALVITTGLGCVVGLPLAWIGGWEMIVIGALCVLSCFLYTTKLSYLGLGDLLVLVFFGIIPVCLTCYLSLPETIRTITFEMFIASLACGFVIDTLLLINNNRDIDNDRRDGKITLVVKVGAKNGKRLYMVAGLTAIALGLVFALNGRIYAFLLPALIYTPIHTRTYRRMVSIDHGKELNVILGATARNMFVYGLAVTVGLLVG